MSQKRVFGKYLQQFPEQVRKIALNLRVLILELMPKAQETVHPGMKWIAYGAPRSIIAIKPDLDHVKLIFFEGSRLVNSDQLLDGSGSRLRFISIKDVAKMKNELTELIEQAYDLERKKKFRKSNI
jgi:hypothetical protein